MRVRNENAHTLLSFAGKMNLNRSRGVREDLNVNGVQEPAKKYVWERSQNEQEFEKGRGRISQSCQAGCRSV